MKKRLRVLLMLAAILTIGCATITRVAGGAAGGAIGLAVAGPPGMVAGIALGVGSADLVVEENEPQVINIDGEGATFQEAPANVFSLLEMAIKHWWVFVGCWFLPSPMSMIARLKKKFSGDPK
jgi:hypothetical protein